MFTMSMICHIYPRCCPELGDDDLEIQIMQGLNYSLPAGKYSIAHSKSNYSSYCVNRHTCSYIDPKICHQSQESKTLFLLIL